MVADPLEWRRDLARKSLGAETCRVSSEILQWQPDALLVASPPSTHLEIWNHAARHRLPVFMEKPFVLNGELSRADSSPGARRLLMMDFSRRFWPVYAELREMIRRGAVGAVEFAGFTLHIDLRTWCAVTAHRLWPQEGGALYDLGSQALDLASYLFDADPSSIEAETSSHRWDADQVRLHLGFPGGLRVCCDLAYGDRTCERTTIQGRDGRLHLNDPNMTIHVERGRSRTPAPIARGRDWLVFAYRGVWRARSMARYSIGAALSVFLRGVSRGEPFSPGFDDAVKNATWLEVALRNVTRRSARGDVPGIAL